MTEDRNLARVEALIYLHRYYLETCRRFTEMSEPPPDWASAGLRATLVELRKKAGLPARRG